MDCVHVNWKMTLDEDTDPWTATGFSKLFILVKHVLDLVMIA